jgi:hypothetical protein
MTCRVWLGQYEHYAHACACIDEAIARIEAKHMKSRRNWWETLAGGPGGKPSVREGITFPVLEVAQIRQGMPVTPNAVRRRSGEEPPPDVVATKRWQRKRGAAKLKQRAKGRDIGHARAG